MTDTLLGDLRGRFRETSQARLGEMAALLDALERAPHDVASLEQLAKHFHGLAGMGGTYGFPRVSELGDAGEGELLALVRAGAAPVAAQLARWQALVAEIRLALDGGEVPAAPRPAPFTVLLAGFDRELAAAIDEALDREGIACVAALPADVVVVFGEDAFEEKVRAIRSGADLFITRPVDVEALARRVVALRERKARPPRRILAVEDDPVAHTLLRGILGAAGYEVAICSEAAEFERTLIAFAPDLVLMDVQLTSDLSGHDLVRYVRQSQHFATLPVIVVTSDSQRRAMLDSAHAGADLFVPKPVDWDLLLSQIGAALDRATAVRELTDRDPLTGVLTRAAFETRARQLAAKGDAAALVLLDLDRFKEINDTRGHAAGDRVLASTGALLRRSVRASDAVARYGGEEFALLLDGMSVPSAVALCERLMADLQDAAGVTFSAGVAPLERDVDETLRRADAALYEAKRGGRARVVM